MTRSVISIDLFSRIKNHAALLYSSCCYGKCIPNEKDPPSSSPCSLSSSGECDANVHLMSGEVNLSNNEMQEWSRVNLRWPQRWRSRLPNPYLSRRTFGKVYLALSQQCSSHTQQLPLAHWKVLPVLHDLRLQLQGQLRHLCTERQDSSNVGVI